MNKRFILLILSLLFGFGCTPKVQLESPKKPITINLNIKLEHKMKIQLEKDVDKVFANNPELF